VSLKNKPIDNTRILKWAAPCLAALALVSFGSTLLNGFVIDDRYVISGNFFIRNIGNIKHLFTGRYFTGFMEQSYRPLVTLSYMIDYQIWGLDPFGYHLHNLVLHMLNVVLVFHILRGVKNGFFPALVCAGLFAAHTISGEAVNGVSFREDLQAVFLMLCCAALLLKNLDDEKTGAGYMILLWIVCALPVLAKENGIVLPFILAGIAFAKKGRHFYRKRGVLWLGCGLGFLVSILIRFAWMNSPVLASGPLALHGTFFQRLIMIVKIQGHYLKSLVYLERFLPNMGGELLSARIDAEFLVSLISGGCLVLWCYILKDRRAIFALVFYILTMGPTSNLVSLNNPIAMRYLYFPAIGLYWLAGLSMDKIREKTTMGFAIGLSTILVLGLAFYSLIWTRHWRDEVSLWKYNVRYTPGYYRPWADLAAAQNNKGLHQDAHRSARKALSLNPEYFYAWSALATSQLYTGKFQESLSSYKQALRFPSLPGARADVYFGMGCSLDFQGKKQESILEYKKALEINPNHSGALSNLAILYCETRDFDKAEPLFKRALLIDPTDKENLLNLSLLYIEKGEPQNARVLLEKVLKLDPQNPRAKSMMKKSAPH